MKHSYLLLFVISLPRIAAADENYISVLNLPKAGSLEAVLFILLCGLLVAAIVLFEVVKVRRERTVENKAARERFAQNTKRFDLNEEEIEVVRAMARRLRGGDANEFFEALSPFEQGIDSEVTDALTTAPSDAALQEKEALLASVRKKLHFTVVEQGVPIASTRNLSSGQQVWILGPKKTVLGQAMVTLVREFSFNVKLSPDDFERMPAFESPLRMAFTRKADGIYGIEVPIVFVDPQAGTITCRHTLTFKRNQLRQDVRVETDFTVSVRCIATETGDGTVQDPSAFQVKMTDLSGGGFAFITDRALSVNDILSVTAASSKLSLGGLQAKIVAQSPVLSGTTGRTRYHAKFVNVDFETKESIIKYVFTRLRETTRR
jgi:hypothetical protein